jgi:hypothetical protein
VAERVLLGETKVVHVATEYPPDERRMEIQKNNKRENGVNQVRGERARRRASTSVRGVIPRNS